VLAHALAGAAIFLADNIYMALKLLREHRPTGLLLVPTACHIILDRFAPLIREAGDHLRYVEIGTAALAPERYRHLRELLPTTDIYLPYGLTEARVGYLSPGEDGLLNRMTRPATGLEVRVVDEAGMPVATGETGEIVLRGAGLMRGYWHHSAAEHARLGEHGFRTGDMGRLHNDGAIELLGRVDDVLKVGGRKVVPLEIEMTINRHPDVAESAVVGLPDSSGLLEQQVHAFVVTKSGQTITASELDAHCRQYLETYKIPAHFHFKTSLPKSPVGKIQRQALIHNSQGSPTEPTARQRG
jgi:acyl-coenzyme A synthetase/AMP-(fatty) acid ligase